MDGRRHLPGPRPRRAASTSRRCRTPTWLDKAIAAAREPDVPTVARRRRRAPTQALALRADPKLRGRVDRYTRGQARLRAVRAVQARLLCEGLLTARSRYTPGHVRPADRTRRWPPGSASTTSSAGASWAARRWGCCCGRPARCRSRRSSASSPSASPTPPASSRTVRSTTLRRKNPPTWRDARRRRHPVPDLIGDHVNALLAAIGVATPEDMIAFLRAHKDGLPGAARRVQGAAAARVLRSPTRARRRWTCRSRSIAATSGTTSRSTRAASRSCSAATTTRT